MEFEFFKKNKPASEQEIIKKIKELDISSENHIVKLWKNSDGGELTHNIKIYSTSEIVERNKTYEIDLYFPEYILIGDDSGGRLILAKKSKNNFLYFIDAGSPSLEGGQKFLSLERLIEFTYNEEASSQLDTDNIDIVSTGVKKITAKDVLLVKKTLNLEASLGIIKESLCIKDKALLCNVNKFKYEKSIQLLSELVIAKPNNTIDKS